MRTGDVVQFLTIPDWMWQTIARCGNSVRYAEDFMISLRVEFADGAELMEVSPRIGDELDETGR